MIRTTCEAPFFGLWRDAGVLSALADPQYLTTARYEPILRGHLGGGHLDLLFESAHRSCILGGIRLEASNLLIRARSPFIWPARLATAVAHAQLCAIEQTVTPWLRSIARARNMASESIRCFAPSDRFNRAREADLVGAAPLERAMLRMAPFVYARRFAANARVVIACKDGALGQAILADLAGVVEQAESSCDDDSFARAWYGLAPAQRLFSGKPDIIIAERRGERYATVVVETASIDESCAPFVKFPSPVPWDLLFSFDTADAPAVSRFGVYAVEPPIRESQPLTPGRVLGGSSGSIVLGVSAEALAMRGVDIEEVEILARRLAAEGFRVRITSLTSELVLADAQLIHIFGARFESHTVAFAELALQCGINYIFDLPPMPIDPSTFLESTFSLLYRAALDDAEIARYMHGYEQHRLDSPGPPEPSTADYMRIEARFAELTGRAAAVLAEEEDLDALRACLPPTFAHRIKARGTLAEAEPIAAAIGHLVPHSPFVLIHGTIAARSHSLYAALSAERRGVPLVIAGSVYDVTYLQTLRATAPNAIILADADEHTVSALYRRAALWIDAAPRPRSAACLLRAVACGALPVLAAESPLSRIAGSDAPTFSLTSVDDCARVIIESLTLPDRLARIKALQARLLIRRDPSSTLGKLMGAYALAETAAHPPK